MTSKIRSIYFGNNKTYKRKDVKPEVEVASDQLKLKTFSLWLWNLSTDCFPSIQSEQISNQQSDNTETDQNCDQLLFLKASRKLTSMKIPNGSITAKKSSVKNTTSRRNERDSVDHLNSINKDQRHIEALFPEDSLQHIHEDTTLSIPDSIYSVLVPGESLRLSIDKQELPCADEGIDVEIEDIEKTHTGTQRPRLLRSGSSDSTVDDSGFSSSTSEDKDDALETSSSHSTTTTRPNSPTCEAQLPECRRSRHSSIDSESDFSDPNLHPLASCTTLKCESRCRQRSNLSIRESIVRSSQRPKVCVVSSHSPASSREQTANSVARTRQRSTSLLSSTDRNNNSWSLRSQLWSAPFQLVDLFWSKGFLAFLACISYTLFLMFAMGVLGIGIQFVKSFLKTEDLRELRDNMSQSRRRRAALSSG